MIKVFTRISRNKSSNSYILFVKIYGNTGCRISVANFDQYCQSSELLVDVVVLRCASKE